MMNSRDTAVNVMTKTICLTALIAGIFTSTSAGAAPIGLDVVSHRAENALSAKVEAVAAAAAAAGNTASQHDDIAGSNIVALRQMKTTLGALIPTNSLTHFCVVSGWDSYNKTLDTYANMLGEPVPTIGLAGGPTSNGTYLGKQLMGSTKIAFLRLNNQTMMEFLAGQPDQPSWWRDVYNKRGKEVHHMGYAVDEPIWPLIERIEDSGLGQAVQWARWGTINKPGSGCYVYINTVETLGVTMEILANGPHCDTLPKPW